MTGLFFALLHLLTCFMSFGCLGGLIGLYRRCLLEMGIFMVKIYMRGFISHEKSKTFILMRVLQGIFLDL